MAEPTRPSPEALLAHSGWVWRLARGLTSDAHQAEDIVQETWLAALRSGPGDPRGLRRWLATVVRNFAGRSHRSRARRGARERGSARPERVPATGELCERAEAHRRVVSAVLELDEPYRTAILMRYLDELPPRRIAEELAVPVRTVNTRIARGLARLRERLDAAGEGDYRAWLLPLVPAPYSAAPIPAAPVAPAAATPTTLGVLLMNNKLGLALAAALLAVFSAAAYRWVPGEGSAQPDGSDVRPLAVGEASSTPEPPLEAPGASGDRVSARPEVVAPAEAAPVDASHALLSGRVIDPVGEPVGGARVTARLFPASTFEMLMDTDYLAEGREIGSTETDPSGAFQLRLLRLQPHALEVAAPGYARTVVAERYAGAFVVIQLQPASTLFGFVTRAADDTPVAGARVRVTHGDGELETVHLTDASGAYRAEDLVPGTVGVLVMPRDEAVGRYRTLEVAAGRTVQHDVRVEAGSVARGRITDRVTGLPIVGAEVSSWNFYGKTVRSDEAGFFQIAGVEATRPVNLVARAEGYGRLEREFQPGAELAYDLALTPGSRATGRVLDPDGVVVDGAYVAAVASEPERGDAPFDWRSTRTRTDGTFELRDLRSDVPYALFVRKTSCASLTREFPAPSEGGFAFGDLRLGRSASVEGRVVDSAGAGHAAWVNLLGPFAPGSARDSTADVYLKRRMLGTDDEGGFRCTDLAPGLYDLRVATLGRPRPEAFAVELGEGQALTGLELVLPAGLALEGRVLDPYGAPLARVEIGLSAESPLTSASRTRTGADGGFRITGLEPGSYTLSARLWGAWPGGEEGVELAPFRRTGLEAGAAPLEIVLAPQRAVIAGRVLGADGESVAQAFVFVHAGLDQPDKGVLTDEQGRFRLPVVEQVEVELRARRTLHLSQWAGDFRRIDVLIGRKILESGTGDAREAGVLPGREDVVLTLGD